MVGRAVDSRALGVAAGVRREIRTDLRRAHERVGGAAIDAVAGGPSGRGPRKADLPVTGRGDRPGRCSGGGDESSVKLAVTVLLASIVTVSGFVDSVRSPVNESNDHPVSGVAVSSTVASSA